MKLIMENWKRFLKESRDEYPEDEDLDVEPWSPEQKKRFNREWDALEKENPAPEIEVDLDEGMDLDSAEDHLDQMSEEAEADILDAVESAQTRGYDATNNGLEQVLQTLSRSGGPLRSELPILKPLIQSLLGNPKAVANRKRNLDLGEVDPDAHEL